MTPIWATRKRVVEGGRTRVVYEAWCATCGDVVRLQADTRDQDLILNNYRAKGWTMFEHSARCPKCVTTLGRHDHKEGQGVDTTKAKAVNMTATVEPTIEEVGRIVRKINEVFDDGRYLDGWSDRKVAEVLDIAPAKVTRARDLCIGPIKEDPAVTALRSEVEAVEEMLKGIKTKLDTVVGA